MDRQHLNDEMVHVKLLRDKFVGKFSVAEFRQVGRYAGHGAQPINPRNPEKGHFSEAFGVAVERAYNDHGPAAAKSIVAAYVEEANGGPVGDIDACIRAVLPFMDMAFGWKGPTDWDAVERMKTDILEATLDYHRHRWQLSSQNSQGTATATLAVVCRTER